MISLTWGILVPFCCERADDLGVNGPWERPKCLHKMAPGYSWEGTFPFLLGSLELGLGRTGAWGIRNQPGRPGRYLLEHLFICHGFGLDSWLGHKQESMDA